MSEFDDRFVFVQFLHASHLHSVFLHHLPDSSGSLSVTCTWYTWDQIV